MTTASQSIRERVVTFGSEGNLLAIATELRSVNGNIASQTPDRPTLLILNAGVLHRVGPHRLHVMLARRMAALGYPSVRLDLSGIGDSRPLPDDLTFRESSVADIRATMDALAAQSGATRFLIFGLCSGADNGLATAKLDNRVAGLMLVDPPAYANLRSRLRKIWIQVRRAAFLKLITVTAPKMVLRALARGTKTSNSGLESGDQADSGRVPPPPAEYLALLEHLTDRSVRILSVYSGANSNRYNQKNQLFEIFPRLRGKIDVAFFPDANHVFTESEEREKLLELLMSWCHQQFG